MTKPLDIITLAHGSGGTKSRDLVRLVFLKHFAGKELSELGDSAIIETGTNRLAFTTDSFVVKPLFFPGGDIGKLAICGTVNDLAVAGARPKSITASFIIEEGTEIELIDKVAASMSAQADEAKVSIVAGDTKVVERGGCDTLFITTAGIGEIITKNPISPSMIRPGDAVIINGPIADHGMAIMSAREGLSLSGTIESDCAPLGKLVEEILVSAPDVRFMRDATRGGLATVLCEAVDGQSFGIEIDEAAISVREPTRAACEILGIDPLYVANEGKLVAIVPSETADFVLRVMRSHKYGSYAALIGRVTKDNPGILIAKTPLGTKRLVTMLSGDQLPRIC